MKKIFSKIPDYYIIFCVFAFIGWLYEVLWMWFVVPPYHFINRGVLLGPFLPIYGFGVLILLFMLHKFIKKTHKVSNPINLIVSVMIIATFTYTTLIEYTTLKIYHISDYLSNYGLGLIVSNVVAIIASYLIIFKSKNNKLKNIDVTIILVFSLIWIITTLLEYISHFVMDKQFNIMLWDYTKDFLNINARVNWDASRNFAIGGTIALYVIQPLVDKFLDKSKRKKLIALVIGIIMLFDFIFHVFLKLI